jgi:hypothetical protein
VNAKVLGLKFLSGLVKCLLKTPLAVKHIGVNIPNKAGIQAGRIFVFLSSIIIVSIISG